MHDGHNYRQHELVSRQLEKEFGHARIQGAHVERDGQPRPARTPPDWSMQQAVKSGIQPRDVAATVKQLWKEADSARSFAAALDHEGLPLALGRRDLVVLDHAGDVHTLARCLDLKVADIRERMAGIDRSTVPTVEQAREAIRDRNAQKEPPAPASDGQQAANDNRAEINALAAMLQKQVGPEPREASDNAAAPERMTAFGFDDGNAATRAKWQELGTQADAGRITEKDRIREMAQYLWHEADKERRSGQKEKSSNPEGQQNEQAARDRQREQERER